MEFVEASLFTRLVPEYLSDAEYQALQQRLFERPEAGAVIPGTGGIRKLRWREPGRGKGGRGGLRLIYYLLREDHQIWLLTIYSKDELADLREPERRALKELVDAEVTARAARRKSGSRRRQ